MLLGAGVTVDVQRAPSCLEGCRHGEALVRKVCGCRAGRCLESCSELRLKWVQLSREQLSSRGVVVQRKSVDVPLSEVVAYATQHRWLQYLAAMCCAVALLAVLLFSAFWLW